MAHSVVIPVDVEFNMDKAQLTSISKAIDSALKTKDIKAKDFFAPISNSAKKLSVNLKGLKFGDFFNKFSSSAKKLSSNLLNINNSVKSLSSSFSGLRRIATQALSIAAIGNVGKKMVKLSSDLIEVQNVVDTVFGDMSDDINDFAQSALKSFGLTELQAKNFVSVFGGLLEASDIVGDAQKEMAINLTKLTGDVASFYNMDYDEVFNKLQSGLTGEVKAMRSFGVNMTITNLEAWALAHGITKSYDAMNQAEKTALRYNYMLEKLSNAQGDFNKTQGSWANQTRILVSQIQQLGGILGGFLQKILYPILTVINQIIGMAISGATALAKMFGFDVESIQVQQGVSGAGAGVAIGDTGASAMDDLADSTNDATKAQKKLNKEQNKSLANIHELNVLSSNKSSDSSGSSGAGGIGGAGIGDIGFDLSKYKDISEMDNPINTLFKNLEKAVKENNWRGVGSLLAAELNELMSKIDLAQYIPAVEKGAFALAEILNGFVQNVHFDEIGRIIGEGANLIMAAVNKFYDQFDFVSLGQQIAKGLNSLFETVDFEALGQFLVNNFNAIFQTLAGFVTEFDWENLGIKLSEGINSIFNNFDFNSFSISVYGGINGVFETIGTTILNLDWVGVGEKFAKSFSTIFSNINYGLILTTIIKGIEGILLSISTFLAKINWDSIFEQFKTGINTAINVLGDVDFATIASNLSTGIINLASSLADLIKGIDWMQLGVNLYNGIKGIVMNIDWLGLIGSIGELIFNALGAISTVVLTLVAGLIIDIVNILWSISGKLAELLRNILALVAEGLGNIIGWVIAKVYGLGSSIGTWISNLITNIGTWLSNIWSSISTWFTNLITSIGNWLSSALNKISNWFTSLPSKIGGWLGSVGNKISTWISGIWSNFTSFLGNIISYITGTFSSAWSKAWNGIKSVFTGVFNTVGGIFKSIINTVIDGINTVINAINKISWDVPDWVPGIGGSTFGFSIPNIPKLANGAVIPPNHEFLAVLGDQRRGVNIETPLDTMLQAFRGALAEFSDYNGGDIIIPIYVNNELSSEEIIRKQNIARYRSNGK